MTSKKNKNDEPHKVEEPLASYGNERLDFQKVWFLFKENEERMKETDEQMKETDKRIKETDRIVRQLSTMFTSNWGKLMEALISPSCLKLFRERGFDIHRTYTRVEIDEPGLEGEFDIILANGKEVVIIEVKTTLKVSDVNYFLEKMARIREFFPDFKDKSIYGGVAAISYDESSNKYALRKGLFVIVNSGEGLVKIANKKDFAPIEF